MTNTPERIWANTVMIADDAHLCGEWNYKSMGRVPDTEYTRTDLYAAAIARAETAEAERDDLQSDNDRLRVALRFYADGHTDPNDGPWGVKSNDFGTVAIAALYPNPTP